MYNLKSTNYDSAFYARVSCGYSNATHCLYPNFGKGGLDESPIELWIKATRTQMLCEAAWRQMNIFGIILLVLLLGYFHDRMYPKAIEKLIPNAILRTPYLDESGEDIFTIEIKNCSSPFEAVLDVFKISRSGYSFGSTACLYVGHSIGFWKSNKTITNYLEKWSHCLWMSTHFSLHLKKLFVIRSLFSVRRW